MLNGQYYGDACAKTGSTRERQVLRGGSRMEK